MEENDLSTLLDILLRKVRIVCCEEIEAYAAEAKELAADIDPNDALFFACALAYGATLWSDDKALKKQRRIRVIDTAEMIHENL